MVGAGGRRGFVSTCFLGLPTGRLDFVLAVAADIEGEAGGGGGPLHRSKKDSIEAICAALVYFSA